ncbi:MAG: hypothetical protein U0270_44555 [Labilithrix sp.]
MLAVLVDGVALPEEEARAMWERFSAWMEEHRGDLAGFAKQEGFASVHPGVDSGRPVLLLSREAAQRPYAPVAQDESSRPRGSAGSNGRHEPPRRPQGARRKSRK